MSEMVPTAPLKDVPAPASNLPMEDKANKILTPMELQVYRDGFEKGIRPIGASMAAGFYNLFLEGYSCLEIAKRNPGLSEADVLSMRLRYDWDKDRDEYAIALQEQVKQKLIKTKLESINFLTNMLSAYHTEHQEQILKYLQTRKDEDKPDHWITGSTSYKTIIEMLEKLTGQDKVQKIDHTVNVKSSSTMEEVKEVIKKPENVHELIKGLLSGSNKS